LRTLEEKGQLSSAFKSCYSLRYQASCVTLIAGYGAFAYYARLITTPVLLFIFAFHFSTLVLSHRVCYFCFLAGLGLAHFETSSKSPCRTLHTQITVFAPTCCWVLSSKVSLLFSALRRPFLVEGSCNSVHHTAMKENGILPAITVKMQVLSDLATACKYLILSVFYASYSAQILHACNSFIKSLLRDMSSGHCQSVISPDLGFKVDNILLYACETIQISSSSRFTFLGSFLFFAIHSCPSLSMFSSRLY